MKKRIPLFLAFLFSSILIQAQEEFFDFSEPSAAMSAGTKTEFSGNVSADIRSYLDGSMEFGSEAGLKLTAESDAFETVLGLKMDLNDGGEETVAWQDLIDEAVVKYFFSAGFIEAGYTEVEWGKGDGMHAADPVNPVDQSGGYGREAAELKAPVPLVRAAFYTGANSLLEFVCVPLFVPTQTAEQGRWLPYDIPDTVTVTDTHPNMSLDHLQAGARFTFSAGPADLGFQYYSGYMHDPGFTYLSPTELSLEYTRYQLFAAEAALAAGPFTFRTEVGYDLTEDTQGTDPSLYNSRAIYLAGFDVTVPGTKLYFLAQVSGDHTLDTDGLPVDDVDVATGYDHPSHLTNIAVSAEYPFLHDKLKTQLSSFYMAEANAYYLAPELTYALADDLEFKVTGAFYGGEDKDFSVLSFWDDNDNIRMMLSCSF